MGKAIIVGGGLGGLASALALRKNAMHVQVYEKRKTISGGEGTTIVVAPNGMRSLHSIDPELPSKFIAAGCPSFTTVVQTPDGTEVMRSVLGHKEGAPGVQQYEFPFVGIAWSKALAILKELLPEECLHPGHSLVGIEQDENSVTATFEPEDGPTVTAEGDVLIGADGIWSPSRKALFGLGAEYVVDQGRTMWRAMAQWETHHVPGLEKGYAYTVAGPKTLYLSDAGSGQLYFAFSALDALRENGEDKRSRDGQEMVEVLRSLFSDCPLAMKALENVPPESLLERRVLECPVLKQWAKGRAVLIGDAAHAVPPTIGQGANLAFEDSWDLAYFLSKGEHISEALERFQEQRIPRVTEIADINRKNAAAAYKGKTPEGGPAPWEFIYTYPGAAQAASGPDQ